MNKIMKYILGFVLIFIAALVCVFGIVKYQESRETTSTSNNSTNSGSVDGAKADKDTTVVIDKLASITDVDALKDELNLSDSVVETLKNYAPLISYAVDNNHVYVRRGGYSNINVSEIIGSYEVKDGKLTAINDTLSNDAEAKLEWKNLDIKNTEHNLSAAKELIDKYFFVTQSGQQKLSGVAVFAYLSDTENRQQVNNPMIANYTVIPLSQVVDIYNTALKDTYNEKDVRLDVASFSDMKYREVDDSYTGNEEKYKDSINMGELVFFTQDNMYVAAIGGVGGASMTHPSAQSMWTIDGDRVNIPIIGPDNAQMGRYVLRLNDKTYEGGVKRSKYYIESVSR